MSGFSGERVKPFPHFVFVMVRLGIIHALGLGVLAWPVGWEVRRFPDGDSIRSEPSPIWGTSPHVLAGHGTKAPSVSPYFEGVRIAEEGGQAGYRDSSGGWEIPPVFEEAWPFRQGIAKVRHQGQYGFIRRDGSWLIPPRFADAQPFFLGLAAAIPNLSESEDRLWGFIDTLGEWAIDPAFSEVHRDFREGLALVSLPGLRELAAVEIDTSGGMVGNSPLSLRKNSGTW